MTNHLQCKTLLIWASQNSNKMLYLYFTMLNFTLQSPYYLSTELGNKNYSISACFQNVDYPSYKHNRLYNTYTDWDSKIDTSNIRLNKGRLTFKKVANVKSCKLQQGSKSFLTMLNRGSGKKGIQRDVTISMAGKRNTLYIHSSCVDRP